MSKLLTNITLATAFLVPVFFSYANAAEPAGNSIVVQSCVENQNLDEQGLIHCYQQAEMTAKDQVFNLSGQGEHYKTSINKRCQQLEMQLKSNTTLIKSEKAAKIAACYANGWANARDEVLNEKY
ncbi:hypothetical protein [Photobacterium leiognathi]|uniref:hypothetical protein n=1 Tax=Photobacterium leiognathi TaxID=553611 RepID=UPI0027324452|nr:hypothetical protein [Photobacterium leiognathi]